MKTIEMILAYVVIRVTFFLIWPAFLIFYGINSRDPRRFPGVGSLFVFGVVGLTVEIIIGWLLFYGMHASGKVLLQPLAIVHFLGWLTAIDWSPEKESLAQKH